MPIEWSGLAPELLLALDRRSGDPLHPRGSLSLSRSLIAAGLVGRLSLIVHPSLAGSSGAGTYPRDGAIRPLSLRAVPAGVSRSPRNTAPRDPCAAL